LPVPVVPVVLVVVLLVLPAPAALGATEAPLLPTAPAEAPVLPAAPAEAPVLPTAPVEALVVPAALEDGLLVVVVLVVDVPLVAAAPRMSMKTTLSPLLALLMKVPAIAGMLPEEEPAAAEEDVLLVDDEPEAPAPLGEVNEPVHWFCVSSCW
jgi:hypothetical protein